MLGDLIVILIIVGAVIVVGRRIYRVFSKDGAQCGCASSDNCSGCAVSNTSNCIEEENSVKTKESE